MNAGACLHAQVEVTRGPWRLRVGLEVPAGGLLAVMGPSGAGKSTLLQALAGFTPLSDGVVRVGSQTVDAAAGPHVAPQRRGVVLLGQQPRLFPHLSARENVAFGPRARRVPRARARSDAEDWLERVGLAGLGSRRPAQLSGGQQQRVALARALATGPRVLLLDEPLTSLDPATAAEVRAIVRAQLQATGTTAVIATHHVQDAQQIADRLMVIESGRITQEGAVAAVLRRPATPFALSLAASAHPPRRLRRRRR